MIQKKLSLEDVVIEMFGSMNRTQKTKPRNSSSPISYISKICSWRKTNRKHTEKHIKALNRLANL